jgi:hypothetical protein
MRRKTVALVALLLSACTAVTTVTVTPHELHALAGIGPDERRAFTGVDEDDHVVARGSDDVRLLVAPIGQPSERAPSVEQAPWGKLYTLRWGSSVSLTPIDHGNDETTFSLPSAEVTGGEVRVKQYSGTRTTVLVLCIVGTALTVGFLVLLSQVKIAGGG